MAAADGGGGCGWFQFGSECVSTRNHYSMFFIYLGSVQLPSASVIVHIMFMGGKDELILMTNTMYMQFVVVEWLNLHSLCERKKIKDVFFF